MTTKPDRLLTQNSELRKVGVWNWTLPAHTLKLSDGTWFNTCPNAGACGRVCYAKMGTYLFSNVRRRHLQNLEYVLGNDSWWCEMIVELEHKRFRPTGKPHDLPHDESDRWLHNWVTTGGRAIRIHDAGDFFDFGYLSAWLAIAYAHKDILFYAYTKEVEMVKEESEFQGLPNFRVVYSFGGKQDHLIDRERDRHADVFPTKEALEAAGYFDQSDNDLLAVVAPTNKIGIVANNLPVANKRFAGRTMSEL